MTLLKFKIKGAFVFGSVQPWGSSSTAKSSFQQDAAQWFSCDSEAVKIAPHDAGRQGMGGADGQDENWMFTRLIQCPFLMEIPIVLITSSERTSSPRISCFSQWKAGIITSCVVLKLKVRSPDLLMQFGFFFSLFFHSFSHLIMRSYLGFSSQNMSALKQLSDLIGVLITYSCACIKMCRDAASSPPVFNLAWSQCACLHKIDLFHTGNNSLSTLNDWNLQGSRQSEERMRTTFASEMQPSV